MFVMLLSVILFTVEYKDLNSAIGTVQLCNLNVSF